MSDRTKDAIVTAVVGIGLLLLLRVALGVAFNQYVERVARRKPPDYVARLRTRLVVLRRVLVAFVCVVVVWSVLEIFPTTQQIARTLLASGAVVALFVGVAFSVPLGNIGAGILLSISQPVRIGDNISVGEVTGIAEEITLIHTVVRTDAGLTAYVPNSQLVTSTIVNRTIEAPRRLVSVRLPISHAASVDVARSTLLETARELEDPSLEDATVAVAEVAETVTWLSVSGYLPYGSPVERVSARLREQCLVALARERLLPA